MYEISTEKDYKFLFSSSSSFPIPKIRSVISLVNLHSSPCWHHILVLPATVYSEVFMLDCHTISIHFLLLPHSDILYSTLSIHYCSISSDYCKGDGSQVLLKNHIYKTVQGGTQNIRIGAAI